MLAAHFAARAGFERTPWVPREVHPLPGDALPPALVVCTRIVERRCRGGAPAETPHATWFSSPSAPRYARDSPRARENQCPQLSASDPDRDAPTVPASTCCPSARGLPARPHPSSGPGLYARSYDNASGRRDTHLLSKPTPEPGRGKGNCRRHRRNFPVPTGSEPGKPSPIAGLGTFPFVSAHFPGQPLQCLQHERAPHPVPALRQAG